MSITLKSNPISPNSTGAAGAPQRVSAGLPIALRPVGAAARIFAISAGSVCALVVVLLAAEVLLPSDAKPSTVVGAAIGQAQRTWGLQALEMKKAHEAAMAEERSRADREVQAMQAEVEKAKAAANSRAQQEIALAQGQVEEVKQAYLTLYARAEALNKSYLEVASHVSKLRATLASENQIGAVESVRVATWLETAADLLKAEELKAHFSKVRTDVTRRSAEDYEAMVGRELPDPQLGPRWSQGLPDPAAMRALGGVTAVQPRTVDPSDTTVEQRPEPPAPRYAK